MLEYIFLGLVLGGLWLWQNIQHEASHGLVVELLGGKVTKFVPWPSRLNGWFTMAHVEWDMNFDISETKAGFIYAAPQILNTLLLIVFGIWMFHTQLLIIPALYLMNLVDGAFNLSTFYRSKPNQADGWQWAWAWNMPNSMVRCLAVVWQVGFAALLVARFF